MVSKHCRRFYLLLNVPILLLILLGATGRMTIRVSINWGEVPGSWRLEKGTVVGPVAPVARQLGARVNLRNNVLEIVQPSPWAELNMEPAWAIVRSHSTIALAPVVTLRRYLAEKQFESFTLKDPTAPVLARFEIVSGYSVGWQVPPGSSALDPYILQANLYWAIPNAVTPSRSNPGIQTDGAGGWSLLGPDFSEVRIEQVNYEVKPSAVKTSNYKGKPFQESIGWGEVTQLGTIQLKTVKLDGATFPAYDLSLMQLSEKWRWKGL